MSDDIESDQSDQGEEGFEDISSNLGGCNFDDATAVNGADDLWKINMNELSSEYLMRHFADVGLTFMFYNWYAGTQGFAGRKDKVMKNSNGEITQQIFVCNLQGRRRVRENSTTSRRREPKWLTRCGCEARCKVHIHGNTGRWYIKYLNDVHNHEMMDSKYTGGMLPAHRKMSE